MSAKPLPPSPGQLRLRAWTVLGFARLLWPTKPLAERRRFIAGCVFARYLIATGRLSEETS